MERVSEDTAKSSKGKSVMSNIEQGGAELDRAGAEKPDYKSRKRFPDPAKVFQGMEQRAERQRLEREVIEKAKKWNAIDHRDKEANEQALSDLSDAVDALDSFEAKQK